MESIRQYLLAVISAGIICAVITSVLDKKSALNPFIKLIAGLFMLYAVLSPWTDIRLEDLADYYSDLKTEASTAAEKGSDSAIRETAAIISNQIEAYIMDKASSMGVNISVEVTTEGSTPPSPQSIKITGEVAPYHKKRIQQFISDELGISKENQIWT